MTEVPLYRCRADLQQISLLTLPLPESIWFPHNEDTASWFNYFFVQPRHLFVSECAINLTEAQLESDVKIDFISNIRNK